MEENLDAIKPVAVDGGKGCVAPSYDTISDGSYPISRPLFIYVNKAKIAEKPELKAFVDYYLTDGVISTVLETVPYVNLSADELAATQAAWAAAAALTSLPEPAPGADVAPGVVYRPESDADLHP